MRKNYLLLLALFILPMVHGQNAVVNVAHLGTVSDYIELPVFRSNEYMGSIKGNKTIRMEVAPGEVVLTSVYPDVNFASTIFLHTEPGETYYVVADLKGGAYQMVATEGGQLVHKFLNPINSDSPQYNAMKKLVKKNRHIRFSQSKKTEFETSYAHLVQSSIDLAGDHAPVLLADAAAGPSGGPATLPVEKENFPENKRELALQKILEQNQKAGSPATEVSSENTVVESDEGPGKIRNSEDNNTADLRYRRSSLYTMMINDTDRQFFDVIRDAFGNFELSEKFNDQNIGPYLIDAEGGEKDQSEVITAYLNENGVARELVAKWFNRNSKGEFDMELVAARGSYNASDLDAMIARDSKRGMALLADAGEELIGNTFVVVNDYKYVNKEEVANKASGILSVISDVATIAGYDGVALAADATNLGAQTFGKGYVVKTTSYLYRLVWNEEIENQFYTSFWIDSKNFDPAKKKAFETTDLFKLKLVGSESAWADLQSTIFTKKSDQDLIRIATVRATDKGISKLQRKFEEFRTKSPLLGGDPISAKIGLKEGLEKGDKFEVLEQIVDKEGRTRYKRVGKIKVDHKKIWDNTFMAGENPKENSEGPEYTVFKGAKNKYYSGMLIRQIN